jgi:hypothetical protein
MNNELFIVHRLTSIIVLTKPASLPAAGRLTLTMTKDFYFLPIYKLPQNFMEFYKDRGGMPKS